MTDSDRQEYARLKAELERLDGLESLGVVREAMLHILARLGPLDGAQPLRTLPGQTLPEAEAEALRLAGAQKHPLDA